MRINKNLEIIFLTVLFIISLYLWSLPYQDNIVPYGDVDSSTHFTLSYYMSEKGVPTYWLPYYMGYVRQGAGKLWYPPQYHLTSSILSLWLSNDYLGILLFQTIACFCIIFTSYFFMRELFGNGAAMLTSILMMFSIRDILWYLWGQYPQVLSFGITPIVIYSFYRYLDKKKPIYLYMTAMLAAVQFFIHPQALFISGGTSITYYILYTIKNRRLQFQILPIIIAITLFLGMIIPFYSFPFGTKTTYAPGTSMTINTKELGTLFHWYSTKTPVGVPQTYYSFSDMIGTWLLPFILVGVIFLLIRRKNSDLLLLSWLFTYYLASHDQVFGLARFERFIETELHILAPIAVVGLLAIPSLIRLKRAQKQYLKVGLISIFIVLTLYFNAQNAYASLNNAYGGLLRLTPYQLEAVEWVKMNIPDYADIHVEGTAIYSKKKWMRQLSFKHITWSEDIEAVTHVMVDYSDLMLIGNKAEIDKLREWESTITRNATLLYDKNNIKVYDLET